MQFFHVLGKLYNQSTSDSELNGNSDITFETIQQALTLGEVQIPPSLTISCSNLQISNLVGQGIGRLEGENV